MALITYAQAVSHLKQNGVLDALGGSPPDEDSDLVLKIEQASAMVLIYLKRPGEWDIDAIPADDPEFALVQAAVLKVLGNLYRFRGDDEKPVAPVSEDIVAMLSMLRDPASV
jgi:hypothetical protein